MFLESHRIQLDSAIAACRLRAVYTGYAPITAPSHAEAERLVAGYAGTTVTASNATTRTLAAQEVSPYTGKPLDVSYTAPTAAEALAAAAAAAAALRVASAADRVGVCLEALHRIHDRGTEFAAVTAHTTGQSPGMAATGSGTNALDRGLEAVAMAWAALERIPSTVSWTQMFGDNPVTLRKRYRTLPVGTALVIACASFPAWNAYPAIMANLATGNPVLVKPHPHSILGTALAVSVIREVLVRAGLPADAVQLVVDTADEPIARVLAEDPAVRIVDFTGSPRFGRWLETNLPDTLVFTETAGVNTVVLDSVDDLSATMRSLATGLSLFSGQMCTTPQNIYLPRAGIRTGTATLTPDEVIAALVAALDDLAATPRRAAAVCGAVQSPDTVTEVAAVARRAARRVVRPGAGYRHPDHPDARTLTPLVVRTDPSMLPAEEVFGPVVFLVDCPDTASAIRHATDSVRAHGAISSYLYATDDAVIEDAADAYAEAGASLSVNLASSMPMQYAAAYSDYHVTGLNPAGNATLTDESFIAGRFRIVQDRRQVRP